MQHSLDNKWLFDRRTAHRKVVSVERLIWLSSFSKSFTPTDIVSWTKLPNTHFMSTHRGFAQTDTLSGVSSEFNAVKEEVCNGSD